MTDRTADLADVRALIETAAVAVPVERDLLVVTGSDAATYLQGQLSQDVEGLAVGSTARTLLLQPQGKIDAWLRVHRRGPEVFWLDTDPGHGAVAEERLNRFKLRVEVTIDSQAVRGVGVRGVGSDDLRARAGELAAESAAVVDAGWGGIAGFDVIDPDGSSPADAVASGLGLPLATPPSGELIRIRQGLPAMGLELDGSTIPAAAGIVDQSVDFTKGCYVGQELVARVDSRGNNTPTRLHLLRIAGPTVPEPGTELLHDGQVAGRVTSAVADPGGDVVGLGYLKRSVEASAALTVRVGSPAAEAPVEAAPLPVG